MVNTVQGISVLKSLHDYLNSSKNAPEELRLEDIK